MAHVELWCGDLEAAGELADEGVNLSRRHGIEFHRVTGSLIQAYLHGQSGEPEAALSLLAEGLARHREMGALCLLPLYLCFVADAYHRLGRIDEGLATVADATRMTETNVDVFWEAELYRLKGELTLCRSGVQRPGPRVKKSPKSKAHSSIPKVPRTQHPTADTPAEAEAYFLRAVDIARRQKAKSLELRAVMSLGRLWHVQGKTKPARQLLAEVYGWFTEGFDTKDLQEAKALLDTFRA